MIIFTKWWTFLSKKLLLTIFFAGGVGGVIAIWWAMPLASSNTTLKVTSARDMIASEPGKE